MAERESLKPTQLFHILLIDISDPDGNLEKLPEHRLAKLLMLFYELVDCCCDKFDVTYKTILGSGVLLFLKAENTTLGILTTIRLAVTCKNLVESQIPLFKVKISIHSEKLVAWYNNQRCLKKIDGLRTSYILEMDKIAAQGKYSRIILSESAYTCIKNYIEVTFFSRIVADSLNGTKGLLRLMEVCDTGKFLSKINQLYEEYGTPEVRPHNEDIRGIVKNYDVLREGLNRRAFSQPVDHGLITETVLTLLVQIGFRIARVKRDKYHSDYMISANGEYLFLEVLSDGIDYGALKNHEGLRFQKNNRKMIVFLGDDLEASGPDYDELFQRLGRNNLFLILININTLITMHNLLCVCEVEERRAIQSLFFSKSKHLLTSKELDELQYRVMRLYMLRKIEKLKGEVFLEKKLYQMIEKVKSETKDAASWHEIGEVIKLIETLSYQVLRIVNSPTTDYRQTNDIIDASYQLGVQKLENLLKTIRFSSHLPDEFPAYGTARDNFWGALNCNWAFYPKDGQECWNND